MKKKNICHFETCKKKIIMVTGLCKICSYEYCINHNMPELHNCNKFSQHLASIREKHQKYLLENKCVANKVEQI